MSGFTGGHVDLLFCDDSGPICRSISEVIATSPAAQMEAFNINRRPFARRPSGFALPRPATGSAVATPRAAADRAGAVAAVREAWSSCPCT